MVSNRGSTAAVLSFLTVGAILIKSLIRFAKQQPLGTLGGMLILAMVVVAIFSPLIAPHDPSELNLKNKYEGPGATIEGQMYLFGTDQLGRDTFSRMIYGARISVSVAYISVAVGVTLGALLGIITAYIGGALDLTVQRIVDAFMAFPALIFALGMMAVLGPSVTNVIITLVIILVPGSSRVVRSVALSVKEKDYVDAAKAIGCSDVRIIVRYVVPNCVAPYIVFATANLGFAIVVEASLSFLGAGAPIDTPSWGGMLAVAGAKYVEVSPWLVVFPSIVISVVVFGFNYLGDALRDTLDPRLRGTM